MFGDTIGSSPFAEISEGPRTQGRGWMIAGSILTGASVMILVPLVAGNIRPYGVPITALVVVVALFVGMIIARYGTPPSRLRVCLLVVDTAAIVFVTVFAVVLVADRVSLPA